MVLQREHEQAFCSELSNTGTRSTSSGVKSWSSAVGQGQTNSNSLIRRIPNTGNQWGKPPSFINNVMNYADLLNESQRPQPQSQMSSRNQMMYANVPQSNSDIQQPFGAHSLFSNQDLSSTNESSIAYQSKYNSQQLGLKKELDRMGFNSQPQNWGNITPGMMDVETMWNPNQQFQQQETPGYFPSPSFIEYPSHQK